MTMKGQTRDLNTLRVQYLENSWRMLFSNNQLLDLRWGSAVGYLLDSLASFLLLTVCYGWVVYILLIDTDAYGTTTSDCDQPTAATASSLSTTCVFIILYRLQRTATGLIALLGTVE